MRLRFLFLVVAVVGVSLGLWQLSGEHDVQNSVVEHENYPKDWLYQQRAYPDGIAVSKWRDALKHKKQETPKRTDLVWETYGNYDISGRVVDVEMPNEDDSTIFVAGASGGVFRSYDLGESWTPVFDDQPTLSIGDIAISKQNTQLVWVGTGEPNAGGGSITYDGLGVYKSQDQGNTWEAKGLEDLGSIARICIDPQNDDRVYVAAMGDLFANTSQRGVYRSLDGGDNWEQVLFVSDSVGAVDLVQDPEHPDTLYVAMWERVRRPHRRSYGGKGSGVYRSFDGGSQWERVYLEDSSESFGRLGLALYAGAPGKLYVTTCDSIGYHDGVYVSEDAGDSWTKVNSGAQDQNVSYSWWFSQIVAGNSEDEVYLLDFRTWKSDNGASSWKSMAQGVHVDQHALYVHENDELMLLGNDGGLYISQNKGSSWRHVENLPLTQFYTCETSEFAPERVYGGTQDNGTNRTNGGDWSYVNCCDGFTVIEDPNDPNNVYSIYQYGYLSGGEGGADGMGERVNWNTPYILNPHNSNTLYYGTSSIYVSYDQADNWSKFSPNLTDVPETGWDYNLSSVVFNTITSIDMSVLDGDVLYAGTDDGNVWNTLDGGDTWNKLSAELPKRWVTRVVTDPFDAQVAYVCYSGYRHYGYLGHVYKTEDNGTTWQDISKNLPEVPVNDLLVHPDRPGVLFLATDLGVYSMNDPQSDWFPIGIGLPTVPVLDLDFNQADQFLLAATYGRSMYKLDLENIALDATAQEEPSIEVYQNGYTLNVQVPQEFKGGTLEIFDVSGKRIPHQQVPLKQDLMQIPLSNNMTSGVYIVVLRGKVNALSQRCYFNF